MVSISHSTPLEPYAARELLARYDAATAEQRERGRAWYPEYQRRMRRLARETGYTLRQAASVGAITSPNSQLETNLHWTCEILHGRRSYGQYRGSQESKIRRVLTGAIRPQDGAIGPKVSVFYRAIMGDPTAITLDRWAAHAAGLDRQSVPNREQRELLRRVYHRAF